MPCMAVGVGEEEDESAKSEEENDNNDEEEDEDDEPEPPPPHLRIVFLDIDGVLNTRPDHRLIHVEGMPCAMLRRLLSASGAEVVLTTSWRAHHAYIAQVLTNFEVFGSPPEGEPALKPPVLKCTPRHGDGMRRDLEILHWLGANRGKVAAWVALDASDLQSGPCGARLAGHTVRCTAGEGLSLENVKAALTALGCDSSLAMSGQRAEAPNDSGSAGTSGLAPIPEEDATPAKLTCAQPGLFRTFGLNTTTKAAAAKLAPPPEPSSLLRDAFAWDSSLANKMSDVLAALNGPETGNTSSASKPRNESDANAKICAGNLNSADIMQEKLANSLASLLDTLGPGFEPPNVSGPGQDDKFDAPTSSFEPPKRVRVTGTEFDDIVSMAKQRFPGGA